MTTKKIKISKKFKWNVILSIFLIVLFVIVYISLLVLATWLTFTCFYWGITIIKIYTAAQTVLLGAGIMGFGLVIFIFLLKFIFSVTKADRSGLFEINMNTDPVLFEFITNIVNEIGTKFPRRVYLTYDVNAFVFYDSSFWSMFFPIKKNLVIGLGLINTTTVDEIKAILSHEFGHFSQKSMKIGSYVYNVNIILYNMLFENKAYNNAVHGWANISIYFAIFVFPAIWIVKIIQLVAKLFYLLINKIYMSLSREMEFHADSVAANTAGSDSLISALLRFELSDIALKNVLSFYNTKIDSNISCENIFTNQLFVLNHIAKINDIELKNGLPYISVSDINKFNKSKLIIKNQWASHPTTIDRIAALTSLNIMKSNNDNCSARDLITNIKQYQETFTSSIFSTVEYSKTPTILDSNDFDSMYIIHEEKLSFNKIYGYYYDTKNPAIFDESEIKTNNISESDVHELFNVEKTNQISVFYALNSDIHTINQIIERSIKALTFDYDGIRYKRKNSKKLLQKLEIEKTHLEETIKKNDIDIYSFFYKKAKDRNNIAEFVEKGKKNEKYYNTYDVREQIYDNIRASLDFITSGKQMNIDEARERFKSVGSFEKLMRREITDMLNDDVSAKLMTAKIKNDFETYSTKKYMYLKSDGYDVDCLSMLFEVIKNFADINDKTLLELKKDYLEFQVSLIK